MRNTHASPIWLKVIVT